MIASRFILTCDYESLYLKPYDKHHQKLTDDLGRGTFYSFGKNEACFPVAVILRSEKSVSDW